MNGPPLAQPWLRQSRNWSSILLAFPLVTVPLVAVLGSDLGLVPQTLILSLYLALFGVTHFFLTFGLYAQSANLDYFTSTWSTRALFFLAPATILAFMAWFGWHDFKTGPALVVLGGIRLFNYFHLNRQSFGVLQLMKGSWGAKAPPWLRSLENGLLLALTGAMFATYLHGGRIDLSRWDTRLILGLCGALAVPLLWFYGRGGLREPRAYAVPALYLLLQAVSASLAVVWDVLYVASLAMHYVEYHVLMIPRCLQAPLDPARAVDRWFERFRRNRVLFYVALVTVSLLFQFRDALVPPAWIDTATPQRLALHALDGLFVFHYFVEAFVWRFKVPALRDRVMPLYFPMAANKPT